MVTVSAENHVMECIEKYRKGLKKGLRKCGMAGAGFAVANIKANGSVDTGFLKNSVTYSVYGETVSEKTYAADKGGKTGTYSGAQMASDIPRVFIGTNVNYAVYVEMGTGAANVAGGTTKTSWVYMDEHGEFHTAHPMPARPFLKPAVAQHKETFTEILKNAIKEALN